LIGWVPLGLVLQRRRSACSDSRKPWKSNTIRRHAGRQDDGVSCLCQRSLFT
jgi:hypothetical protein